MLFKKIWFLFCCAFLYQHELNVVEEFNESLQELNCDKCSKEFYRFYLADEFRVIDKNPWIETFMRTLFPAIIKQGD